MGTQSIDNSLDRLAHEVQWVTGEVERLRAENADLRRQLAEREEVSTTQGATFSPWPWTFKNGDDGIRDANGKVVINGICGQLTADFVLAAAAPELYDYIKKNMNGIRWDGDIRAVIARIEGRQW